MNPKSLNAEAHAAALLLDEIGREDPDLVSGMVEAETSLMEALSLCIAKMDDCDVIVEGCNAVGAKIKERADKAKRRKQHLRGIVEQALVIADVHSLQMPLATLTIRKVPPKPFVADEAALPAEYWRQPEPVVDAQKLKNAPPDTPGVDMTNGGVSLQIRRV